MHSSNISTLLFAVSSSVARPSLRFQILATNFHRKKKRWERCKLKDFTFSRRGELHQRIAFVRIDDVPYPFLLYQLGTPSIMLSKLTTADELSFRGAHRRDAIIPACDEPETPQTPSLILLPPPNRPDGRPLPIRTRMIHSALL